MCIRDRLSAACYPGGGRSPVSGFSVPEKTLIKMFFISNLEDNKSEAFQLPDSGKSEP